MSGGVDSSVAAAILLEQGWEVVGLTISTHKLEDDCQPVDNKKSCCSYTGSADARKVCDILGIEHHLIDLTQIFKETVIDDFISEYLIGRTPNPCVECNTKIKWGPFLTKANEYGAKYLATGHYSDILHNDKNNRYYIRKAADTHKDQSYALWGLSQEQLSRTIFPLSSIDKQAARELARKFNLPIFNKIESQDICFIPNNDYHLFIRRNIADIDEKIGQGDLILNGKTIGKHKGFPFYTIGQRRGLGVSYSEPLFVKNIDAKTNKIELAISDDILSSGLIADNINFMKYDIIDENKIFTVKIRYNDKGREAYCKIDDNGLLNIKFIEKPRAVTPGQTVVIYEGDDLVAGGKILKAIE